MIFQTDQSYLFVLKEEKEHLTKTEEGPVGIQMAGDMDPRPEKRKPKEISLPNRHLCAYANLPLCSLLLSASTLGTRRVKRKQADIGNARLKLAQAPSSLFGNRAQAAGIRKCGRDQREEHLLEMPKAPNSFLVFPVKGSQLECVVIQSSSLALS